MVNKLPSGSMLTGPGMLFAACEVHYGWARLNARAGAATLTGYAYETIPDKPIPAGVFETAPPESGATSTEGANAGSLGALARGAAR